MIPLITLLALAIIGTFLVIANSGDTPEASDLDGFPLGDQPPIGKGDLDG